MSRRAILIAVFVVVSLLMLAGGWIGYVLAQPSEAVGGGQSRPSPDGRWVAHARTMSEGSVVGGTRRYSELRIDTAGSGPQVVRRMVIEDTAEPAMDWKIEGDVYWSKNSASVTFKCVTGKANLEVTLTP
ncbi:MAG: hypothetical protein ACXW32_09635 [Limisphaerales bacterium]